MSWDGTSGACSWKTVRAMADVLRNVTYEVADRVARITLNRPERGNGITRGLIGELERCVERADLDPAVHVMLLAGNGKGSAVATISSRVPRVVEAWARVTPILHRAHRWIRL